MVGLGAREKPDVEVKTCSRAEEGITEEQSLPHTPDKTHHEPDVHWESVPDALRGAVDDLLEEYNA